MGYTTIRWSNAQASMHPDICINWMEGYYSFIKDHGMEGKTFEFDTETCSIILTDPDPLN